MNSFDPVEYFKQFPLFGSDEGFKPGLKRIGRLLEGLDYDEEGLNYIHVAGSNGKGSTVAMLESIYLQAGYSVGRYTSPHIEEFEERIRVDGDNISPDKLSELAAEIDDLVQKPGFWKDTGRPTFFEVVTAAALTHFSREKPDIAVLETGLGGRLDATNIIESPVACVITNVTLEHTEYLGDTLSEIAAEKAGIIKNEARVICGENREEPADVIKNKALSEGSSVFFSREYFDLDEWEEKVHSQKFTLSREGDKIPVELKLLGEHQVYNAMTATTVASVLSDKFFLSSDDISRGLNQVSWPGRLEVIRRNPPVILDGSHTKAGMKFLREYLNRNQDRYDKITFILAVLEGKDLEDMIEELKSVECEVEIVLTSGSTERALHPAEIADRIKEGLIVRNSGELLNAFRDSLDNQTERELICVTGSLYNVLEIKKALGNSKIAL